MEVFGMVEVAIFMKRMYSDRAEAKKLTDADYKRNSQVQINLSSWKDMCRYSQ